MASKSRSVCGAEGTNSARFYDGPVYPAEHLTNTVGAGDSCATVQAAVSAITVEDAHKEARDERIASRIVSVFEPWVVSE